MHLQRTYLQDYTSTETILRTRISSATSPCWGLSVLVVRLLYLNQHGLLCIRRPSRLRRLLTQAQASTKLSERRWQDSCANSLDLQTKPKAPSKKSSTTISKPSTAPKKLTQSTLKKPAPKKRPKPDSDEENSDPDLDDDSLLSNSPPPAKKPKTAPKAPAAKKAAGKPLDEIDNEAYGDMDGSQDGAMVKPKPKKGTATEQYQKVRYRDGAPI